MAGRRIHNERKIATLRDLREELRKFLKPEIALERRKIYTLLVVVVVVAYRCVFYFYSRFVRACARLKNAKREVKRGGGGEGR